MGRTITLKLDINDARLLLSDLRLAATTRKAGRSFLTKIAPQLAFKVVGPEAPASDDRSQQLIELISEAIDA